jgi:hypothetical protein
MMRFAWTAISSFSALPLRLSIAAGILLSCVGFLYLLRVIYLALWIDILVPGWASVVLLQCIFSGMILLALGAIGDYVGRNYEGSKSRPLYVVASTLNVMPPKNDIARATILTGVGALSVYGSQDTDASLILAGINEYHPADTIRL